MTVETATKISQLDATLPPGSDPKSEGDNHLRLLKSCLRAVFDDSGTFLKPTLPVYGAAGSTMLDPVWIASVDLTKIFQLDQSNQTTGTTRKIRVPNMDSVPGIWEPIGDYSFSAVTNFPVINLAPFRKLRLTGMVQPSVVSGVLLRVSNNNGASYDSGATNYSFQYWYVTGSTATGTAGSQSGFNMAGGLAVDATVFMQFDMVIEGFAGTTTTGVRSLTRGNGQAGGALYVAHGSNTYSAITGRNAIQILPGAGGTITGTLTVEGVRG